MLEIKYLNFILACFPKCVEKNSFLNLFQEVLEFFYLTLSKKVMKINLNFVQMPDICVLSYQVDICGIL